MAQVRRLLAQTKKSKGKLYSLHEPAVDCISKVTVHPGTPGLPFRQLP
jgi:hypothetical protein